MSPVLSVPEGYKMTEVGIIPGDWVCLGIPQIAANRPNAIVDGPFGSDLVSKDYVAVGVPVVRGQNMSCHHVAGDFVFVSKEKAKKYKLILLVLAILFLLSAEH